MCHDVWLPAWSSASVPPHPLLNSSMSSSPLSSSITPSLFTPGSKPTFSTNPSHRRFLLPTWLLHDNGTGRNQIYHAHHFIFSFHILIFFSLFRVVDKAGCPSAFYCTLNTHYRIVPCTFLHNSLWCYIMVVYSLHQLPSSGCTMVLTQHLRLRPAQ